MELSDIKSCSIVKLTTLEGGGRMYLKDPLLEMLSMWASSSIRGLDSITLEDFSSSMLLHCSPCNMEAIM